MSIRPATAADQPAVEALDAACFPKDAWSTSSWAEEFTRSDRRIFVADNGELAGYVVLLVPPRDDEPVDLLRIAVEPAYRRTGVAKELLEAALGARTVLLEVAAGNEAALGLYTAFGFEQISRRRGYYAGGEDAIIMRRAGVGL